MAGIVFPENWIQITKKGLVVPEYKSKLYEKQWLLKKLRESVQLSAQNLDQEDLIALAFSGGLDSSVLAALMCELGIKFLAVTIAINKDHPDAAHAKLMADEFGFDHRIIEIPPDIEYEDMYEILFKTIRLLEIRYAICGDTIDEQLGGYWNHQCPNGSREAAFQRYWKRLYPNHLRPLNHFAQQFGVLVALPYLHAHKHIEEILMSQRVNNNERKIILRQIARILNIPEAIITRPKYGLCNVLQTEQIPPQ